MFHVCLSSFALLSTSAPTTKPARIATNDVSCICWNVGATSAADDCDDWEMSLFVFSLFSCASSTCACSHHCDRMVVPKTKDASLQNACTMRSKLLLVTLYLCLPCTSNNQVAARISNLM